LGQHGAPSHENSFHARDTSNVSTSTTPSDASARASRRRRHSNHERFRYLSRSSASVQRRCSTLMMCLRRYARHPNISNGART
jgi:hypothetical protein